MKAEAPQVTSHSLGPGRGQLPGQEAAVRSRKGCRGVRMEIQKEEVKEVLEKEGGDAWTAVRAVTATELST